MNEQCHRALELTLPKMKEKSDVSFTGKNEILFTSPECDIFYNSELRSVETCWKGLYSQGDSFREILNNIIELLVQKKSNTVLADARKMKIISEEDRNWIVEDWYPRAKKAGFRRQALIITEHTFNEQAIKKIVKNYDHDEVITQYFINYEDAVEWIKQQGNNFGAST